MKRLTFKELKEQINSEHYWGNVHDDAIVYLQKKKGYEYIEIQDKHADYIIPVNHLEKNKIKIPSIEELSPSLEDYSKMNFEFDKKQDKELRKQTDEHIHKHYWNNNRHDLFGTTEYLIEFQVNRLKDDPNFKEFLKELINQEKE